MNMLSTPNGRKVALLTAAVALMAVTSNAGDGAEVVTTHEEIPLVGVQPVPCAGEGVSIDGLLKQVSHTTTTPRGTVHMQVTRLPAGLTGVGTVSGDTYQGTGVLKTVVHGDGLPFVTTLVNSFKLIGPGTGNNLLIQVVSHVTVDANGVTRTVVDNFSFQCK